MSSRVPRKSSCIKTANSDPKDEHSEPSRRVSLDPQGNTHGKTNASSRRKPSAGACSSKDFDFAVLAKNATAFPPRWPDAMRPSNPAFRLPGSYAPKPPPTGPKPGPNKPKGTGKGRKGDYKEVAGNDKNKCQSKAGECIVAAKPAFRLVKPPRNMTPGSLGASLPLHHAFQKHKDDPNLQRIKKVDRSKL